MDRVSLEDLRMMYSESVVLLKNKPVLIEHISEDLEVRLFDLMSQSFQHLPFNNCKFQPPARRIGNVNISSGVVYVVRNPVRKFKIGISAPSLGIHPVIRPKPDNAYKERIRSLMCIELGNSICNKYPSLSEALYIVNKFGGAMAFDKQFAVDGYEKIYYKAKHVGKIGRTGKVEFAERYKYLELIWNCSKT